MLARKFSEMREALVVLELHVLPHKSTMKDPETGGLLYGFNGPWHLRTLRWGYEMLFKVCSQVMFARSIKNSASLTRPLSHAVHVKNSTLHVLLMSTPI